MHARSNYKLANIFEQAVVIDAISGAANAWAFLQAHDVPIETILRVLSTASVRRKTDTPSAAAIARCR